MNKKERKFSSSDEMDIQITESDKERIFAMSRKMYMEKKNSVPAETESELFQIEPKQRTFHWQSVLTAAACLLICIGTIRGIYALNQMASPVSEEIQTADQNIMPSESITETETDLETETDTTVSHYLNIKQETKKPIEKETESESVSDTVSSAEQNVTETQTNQETDETEKTTDFADELTVPEVENQMLTVTQIPETQPPRTTSTKTIPAEFPEPETIQPEPEPETVQTEPVTESITEMPEIPPSDGFPSVPGFTVTGGGFGDWYLTPASMEGDIEILTKYAPSYLPEGSLWKEGNVEETRVAGYRIQFSDGSTCIVWQLCKEMAINHACPMNNPLTPMTINGHPAYLLDNRERNNHYELVWDEGNYIFSIMFTNYSDEFISIAESFQPID